MRKNIVVSMLIIAMAAALLGGATFAWFTDQKEVDATFTAGTIKLGDPGAAFSIEDIAPGWGVDEDVTWDITIENDGTLDMYYRWYFTGEGILSNALEVRIGEDGDWVYLADYIGLASASDAVKLDTEGSENLTLCFRLPTTVGDVYQGESFSGTLVVEATQADYQNPDDIQWYPAP